MPTNETFDKLIQDLTQDITVKVHNQVQEVIGRLVAEQINQLVTPERITEVITNCVNNNISQYIPDLSAFDQRINATTDGITAGLNERANRMVLEFVAQQVNQVDVPILVRDYVLKQMTGNQANTFFPENSIPGSAIAIGSLRLTGDNVSGGVIKSFASTGIDDQASSCQMTVMDQGTVFESTLYAPRMDVRGDLTVDGQLIIRGGMDSASGAFESIISQTAARVQETIGPNLLDRHQDRVFEKIRTEGVELGKLTIGGREIFNGRMMTAAIVDSQLETVGVLRDLQTQGETLLCGTLYTTKSRVGINTMDPATALSIWEEEVELGIGKQQKDTARIATRREQRLVLGSNGKDNLIVLPDGSVQANRMTIGNVTLSSSPTPPSNDAPRGSIVFNENPNVGGPMGWVSLGNAAWANFGIID
jgi:phage baseplate assembly protein gpV